MKFFSVVASAMMVAYANAAAFTNMEFNVQANRPFTITWTNQTSSSVTLVLKNGPQGNLKDVLTIGTVAGAKSLQWTPPATLPTDKYAFEILDGGVPNWSAQFDFVGAAVTSSSSSAAPTTTPSSSSSSTTTVAPSSSSSTTGPAPSSSTTGPRPTGGGTPITPNGGMKSQSSPIALVAVMIATLLYFH